MASDVFILAQVVPRSFVIDEGTGAFHSVGICRNSKATWDFRSYDDHVLRNARTVSEDFQCA